MMDKVREEYEAWIKTEFDGCMPRRKGKGYLSQYVNGAWKAWQASRAALGENHLPDAGKMVAPDGWQLVPVEPTSAMLIAAGIATPRYKAMLAAAPKHEGGVE